MKLRIYGLLHEISHKIHFELIEIDADLRQKVHQLPWKLKLVPTFCLNPPSVHNLVVTVCSFKVVKHEQYIMKQLLVYAS